MDESSSRGCNNREYLDARSRIVRGVGIRIKRNELVKDGWYPDTLDHVIWGENYFDPRSGEFVNYTGAGSSDPVVEVFRRPQTLAFGTVVEGVMEFSHGTADVVAMLTSSETQGVVWVVQSVSGSLPRPMSHQFQMPSRHARKLRIDGVLFAPERTVEDV